MASAFLHNNTQLQVERNQLLAQSQNSVTHTYVYARIFLLSKIYEKIKSKLSK